MREGNFEFKIKEYSISIRKLHWSKKKFMYVN